MDPESRLRELSLALPNPPKPFASYRAAVRAGSLLFVAGQGPVVDGKPTLTGKVGDTVTVEQAVAAARLCALNVVAVARQHLGTLASVKQVVKATVWVAGVPSFTQHPTVADGATTLFREIFGEMGLPARAAVGAPSLPLDIPVEVEAVFEVA